MKIAVDFQSVRGKRTGIGVAAANLLQAMKEEAPDIDFLFYQKNGQEDLNTLERIFWESAEIPFKVMGDKPDLVYSPGFAPAFWSPVRQVVTVHDLIGLALPSNQPGFSRLYWSQWLPFALKRARCLVASSESSRRDIQRFLGVQEKHVRVVPLFVDACFRKLADKTRIQEVLSRHGVKPPFFISVGTLEPRKNLWRLLQAYQDLRIRKKNDFSLVIVGKSGREEQELKHFVEEHGLKEYVKFVGYVPDEELVCLYNAALGYVIVSLYEGFGLPVLEAMSCGLSGVVSNRSSLPEVAGDTAVRVNPENVDEIAEVMKSFIEDAKLRETLSQAAYVRSKEFSSERTARAMIQIFKETVGSNC